MMVGRYARYADYKPSGVEWVGDIPRDWDVKPLFGVAETESRKNDMGAEKNVLSLSYGNIVARDVETNFGLLPASFNTYQIVENGELVLRLTDLQNDKRSLRVGLSLQKGIITSAYLKLMAKKHLLSEYYLYLLLHSYDTTKVFYGMGGGLRQSMKFEEMRRLPVLLPPLPEQTQIAAFLDHETAKIDALIAKQERLIELLEEKRQAVISHAVTKGLNPDAPLRPSGIDWLGDVPVHWETTRIKFEVSNISDCLHTTPTYEGNLKYPAVRTADVSPGKLDLASARLVSEEKYKERIVRLVPRENDILYSREGERFGMAALVPNDTQLCLGQRMMMFRAKDSLDAGFFMWSLNGASILNQVLVQVSGSTSPHINISDVKNFSMPLPPLGEQANISEAIGAKVSKADETILLARSTMALLKERRTALISAAVTGKIDVRDWQPPKDILDQYIEQKAFA